MGGMMEFERTGVYPEYLVFKSKTHHRTWRFKRKEKTQEGILKIKGEVICHYIFKDRGCKIQEVKNGIAVGEWFYPSVIVLMCD